MRLRDAIPSESWPFIAARSRWRGRCLRATGRAGALPEPDDSDKARWPGVGSPAHASVITGYNRQTNEVIFDESWGEHARGKRMRAEELEATSYYVFYFSV